MRILVEECSYDPSVLKGVLPEVDEKPAYLVALQRPDSTGWIGARRVQKRALPKRKLSCMAGGEGVVQVCHGRNMVKSIKAKVEVNDELH